MWNDFPSGDVKYRDIGLPGAAGAEFENEQGNRVL